MVYAVNVSFLQIAPKAYPPTQPIAQSWIISRPPSGKVEDSWFYFEIPGNEEKQNKAKDIYLLSAPFLQKRGYCDPAFVKAP
jgi:hypothetical protein